MGLGPAIQTQRRTASAIMERVGMTPALVLGTEGAHGGQDGSGGGSEERLQPKTG